MAYFEDNNHCRTVAMSNPKGFETVCAFVQASIRERTYLLPGMMCEWRKRGIKSTWIWGNKIKAMAYIRKHRQRLYDELVRIRKQKQKDEAYHLMMLFIEIPGFGVAKAGFLTQLCAGKAGCLDVHNIRKYLPNEDASKGTPAWLQTAGNSKSTIGKKVKKYLDLTSSIGGSKVMWNNWCQHIANEYPYHFKSGDDVSRLHKDCVR